MKSRTLLANGNNQDKRMFKIEDLCAYTSMGTSKARQWGKSIGAEKHIGRSVVYDRKIVDHALDNISD